MTDSPRARTPINLSAVLYEQSAAQLSLPAKVSNIDLNFVPSVAFIPNVHIANSLRARTPINSSAVLYEQAAARTGLPAKVSNIDLNFVPSVAFIPNVHIANSLHLNFVPGVAFIPNVHIADSLRARTPINLSAVLYEQAAAQTSLPAKVGNISPRARTLINLSAVLYEQADAQFSLPAKVSIIDLNFVPGVAFDAIGNVELTGNLLGNADRVNNNNNNIAPTLQFSPTALLNLQSLASKRPASSSSDLNCKRTNPTIATLPAKRIKTNEDRKKSTHRQGFNSSSSLKLQKISSDNNNVQLVRDNIEELICVSKVKNNRNNLNIIVTNPTSREFGRVDIKSLTRFESPLGSLFLKLISITLQLYCSIYVLRSVDKIRANVTNVFNTVISKSDKVPTRELSSHIKTELLRDNSRKFYRLVITSEDTHYKQTIKKAYIMSPERASLILFIT
ncbi:hypothetical protein HBI39_204640 [Parastagonospora nodorum]|nr:hypothetical protein HBI39_204640 [Parastagonospora nodorum]